MPRNNQVARQWHLLRTLEASREGVTLQGLAEGLPAEFTRHHRRIEGPVCASVRSPAHVDA
jgi:hypothetical protein